MENKLLIGLAEEKITPKGSIRLSGQFYERISEGVETDIFANAMSIECDGNQAIIVECDLVSIGENLIKLVREKLAQMSEMKDFDTKNLIIGATHVHTAFSYTRNVTKNPMAGSTSEILQKMMPDSKYVSLTAGREPEMNDDESLYFLVDKIANAAKNAWLAKEESSIKFGFGRAAVGMNRRSVFSDGRGYMWGDTNNACFTELEAGNDSGIEIMFIFDKNEKLKGIMANYSCPAQVMEHRSVISSDYWGKVKIFLREKFGEGLIFVPSCAPAGDICPRDMIRWVNGETPINDPNIRRDNYIERRADPSMFDIKGTWKAGKRIAREIIDAFEELDENQQQENIFKHEVISLDLPLRRATQKEYEDSIKAIKEFARENEGKEFNFEDSASLHVFAGNIQRYELQQTQDIYNMELHVMRLGDVAFATNPFELFLNYGNQIRARSLAKQSFLLQLTAGSGAYLPTEAAEKHSHYSAYISSGNVGHEGGELLVRKTTEEINKMFRD